jgi:Flp pilus assembly protein TadD
MHENACKEDGMKKVLLTALALATAYPGIAADFTGDHNGAAQIAAGDYVAAERVLVRSLRVDANDPELLLNLAAVYAKTERQGGARTLYARVLAGPDERLAIGGGSVARAHALAQTGLSRVQAVSLASR